MPNTHSGSPTDRLHASYLCIVIYVQNPDVLDRTSTLQKGLLPRSQRKATRRFPCKLAPSREHTPMRHIRHRHTLLTCQLDIHIDTYTRVHPCVQREYWKARKRYEEKKRNKTSRRRRKRTGASACGIQKGGLLWLEERRCQAKTNGRGKRGHCLPHTLGRYPREEPRPYKERAEKEREENRTERKEERLRKEEGLRGKGLRVYAVSGTGYA